MRSAGTRRWLLQGLENDIGRGRGRRRRILRVHRQHDEAFDAAGDHVGHDRGDGRVADLHAKTDIDVRESCFEQLGLTLCPVQQRGAGVRRPRCARTWRPIVSDETAE